MTRRTKRLDDAGVAKLKNKSKRYMVPDPELRCHYIKVTPTGVKSFWAVARDPTGKQTWRPIGAPGQMTIDQARDEARKVVAEGNRGMHAGEPKPFLVVWR